MDDLSDSFARVVRFEDFKVEPECPIIYVGTNDNIKIIDHDTIECERLKVNVECIGSTAIVNLEGKWTNRTNNALSCIFAVPMSSPGTTSKVLNVSFRIGKDDSIWKYDVIPHEVE